MRRTKQIDIKRAVVLGGIFSFLCCCAKSTLLPFLTLYFRQLGLSPAMTGIVMGTKCFITLLWKPVASLLAKQYNKRRMVIYCSLVFSAAAALLVLYVQPIDGSSSDSGICSASHQNAGQSSSFGGNFVTSTVEPPPPSTIVYTTTTLKDTTKVTGNVHRWTNESLINPSSTKNASVFTTTRNPKSNDSLVNSTSSSVVTPVRHKRDESRSQPTAEIKKWSFEFLERLKEMDIHQKLFVLILFIVSVWEFASAPLEWTADDGLFEYLDFADASDRYSSSGMWGLLGAACGVSGSGLLVSQLSCVTAVYANRSAAHFYLYAILAVLTLPVAAYLPFYLNKKRDRTGGFLKASQLVRGSPRALLCSVTILLVGVVTSTVDNFLLWQMQDHGSSELHMGLTLSLSLLSRSAFPLLARRVSKLLSPGRVLAAGATCLALQCFYYSFLWGAWAALPVQVLSCFSGGALWWAVMIQCEDVATPGTERSVRRFYTLCLRLGSGLGSLAGGFAAQRFRTAWLFRGTAVGLMAWCAALPLLQWKAPNRRRINYSRLLVADASEASDSDSEQDWLDKAMEDDRSKTNYGRRINH